MKDLTARYPDDHEGAIFYALALLAATPPKDAPLSIEQLGAGIAELPPMMKNHAELLLAEIPIRYALDQLITRRFKKTVMAPIRIGQS
jgi:hypothetical protein